MITVTLSDPETVEILAHARADLDAGAITREQYNDIRLSCIMAEVENKLDIEQSFG